MQAADFLNGINIVRFRIEIKEKGFKNKKPPNRIADVTI
jgi:hypothetical protein